MITADTPLLSLPRAIATQAQTYIERQGSAYTHEDITRILGYYWRYAPPAGLDPLLAIAQCIHETSELDAATGKWRPLSSWWALRPRRNPAGLGVTGETSASPPTGSPPGEDGWARDDRVHPAIWRAGLSFPTWDEASRVHIGRLLAYAIHAGHETPAQKSLIDHALGVRPLPSIMRGTAPTLKLLGAKYNPTHNGWAFPGEHYGERIAAIAEEISHL